MKFYPIGNEGPARDDLGAEYAAARQIGKLRVGELNLFVRAGRRKYYIPYNSVRRVFRRVQLIPAKMCCGKGDFELENLVVCGDEGEMCQVQLPGTRAALAVMEELKRRIPDADFGKPAEE